MTLWKFSPVIREDDPYWKDYGYRRPLLVEARDHYEAQFKASKWYEAIFQSDEDKEKNQSTRCAFNDERLYEIARLSEEMARIEQQKYPMVQ